MSKNYQVAIIETATDIDGEGEIRMQTRIKESVKALNATNGFDGRFELLPISRRGFYGSRVLSTQFAVALSELCGEPTPERADKVHKLSLWMADLAKQPLPAPGIIFGTGVERG